MNHIKYTYTFGGLFRFEYIDDDDACCMSYYQVELLKDIGPYKAKETFHVLCLNICTGEFHVYKTREEHLTDDAINTYPLM